MDLLPIFLDIKNRKCVIVGGGEVALRKASLLIRAGANLHIVSKSVITELTTLCNDNNGHITIKSLEPSDLERPVLVIAATGDKAVNEAVSRHARLQHITVNVDRKSTSLNSRHV